ncbi:MAG: HAMP domain-containing protein [Vicinamibacteria bacterium]|nr:HAMP domain-containing protein [Vicinamibacteria bacterium]
MRGLTRRITLTSSVSASVALLAVYFIVGPRLRSHAIEEVREALRAEAHLVAMISADRLLRRDGERVLDPLVDEMALFGRSRYTVIAADGRVLADSSVSGPELASLDNHGNRPEMRQAIIAGSGIAQRYSATLREDYLYVAFPVRRNDRLLGVVRAARSLADIENEARRFRAVVLSALLAALVVAVLSSALLSATLTRPLHELMDAARRLAAGDLNARAVVRRKDELGELASIIDQAAAQLRARLSESERDRRRIDAILSAMGDGLLAVDHRGHVLLANRSLSESLALDQPAGRHYLESIRQLEVGDVIENVLRAGKQCAAEVELLHPRRTYALIGFPFPGEENAPSGAVISFHDVTERLRLEEVRRDFVANASHELRTPLTSIRGFVEALEDGALETPETARRFLGKIRFHSDRMAALISDLLELSKLETGEIVVQSQTINSAQVVREIASTFVEQAENRKINLKIVTRNSPMITTDPKHLGHILSNLIDNAVKYTPEGGRVEVSALADAGGHAVVEVRDNGRGIPAPHLQRIFERFYRVDKARSREAGGTGLGLSIVKHLAEKIGAQIEVESSEGRGSCFRVRLPYPQKTESV